MAKITKEDVIDFISNISVLELSELVKEMEEKFGVSAAAPVAMMAAGPAAEAGAGPAEEKTEFDVILTAHGDKKIQVIKEVRAITALGRKEFPKMRLRRLRDSWKKPAPRLKLNRHLGNSATQ
jgi:large subunit ribosomal protein L7/L12